MEPMRCGKVFCQSAINGDRYGKVCNVTVLADNIDDEEDNPDFDV